MVKIQLEASKLYSGFTMNSRQVLCLVAAAVLVAAAPAVADEIFLASVSSGELVPNSDVKTGATGLANFEIVPSVNGTDMYFRIDLQGFNIPGFTDDKRLITTAAIYIGPQNANGEPALILYSGPSVLPPAITAFILAEDTVNLDSELLGVSVADFLTALRNGGAYFLVSTTAYPTGELRGQILKTDGFNYLVQG